MVFIIIKLVLLNRIPEEIHRAAAKIRHDIGNVSIVVQNAGRFQCIFINNGKLNVDII